MRGAFFGALMRLAERDDRVFLLVGDLGFGVVEPFIQEFPGRFLNMGVAEQNMTGVAAGLAFTGKIVFTYSIANFPILRCLEQLRNDVCYHKANVKIVSIGGGFSYGALGASHHATEDLAIARALPEMTVIAPGDPVEAAAATLAIGAHDGPCYLRLGRAGEPVIHASNVPFQIGKAIRVCDGDDITLISTGAMLRTAVDVAEALASREIHARVLSMHTLKPLDTEAIVAAAQETHGIVTVEEHSICGGLGGAVAECLAELPDVKVPFKRLGLPPSFLLTTGKQSYLLEQCWLTPEKILASLDPLLEAISADRLAT